MASWWFLKLAIKGVDHFAWPLLALGYPLRASVQAIETDSYAETRDLISYWMLLSLIYLFEYAFMRPLQWFQFWPYIKLMIIFWLIIPNFRRASYVYNNLIRPCISTKPQIVTCRLNNYQRNVFVEKDNFLLHAERYMKDNGTEALEKLIAIKNPMCKPDAESTNADSTTDNKVMQQDIPVMPNLLPTQNASSAMMETKTILGKLPQSSTHKEVQTEWTCALCQVTTASEKILNSHLKGRRHRDTCEALKAKKQPTSRKVKISQQKEELKQKNGINQQNSNAKNANNVLKGTVAMDHKVRKPQKNLSGPLRMKNSKFKCVVCDVILESQATAVSHFNGKKHLANIPELMV